MHKSIKQKLVLFFTLSTIYSLLTTITPPLAALDWPQLAHDPQHTNYSPENLSPGFASVWNITFAPPLTSVPERLYTSNQPIIAGKTVFVGTENGNFYALNADSGAKLWKYPSGSNSHVGPIMQSAGVENGRVFFASMDGCVYALDTSSGTLIWKFDSGLRTGFSSAVLLAEGRVFAANRGGTLFAISQSNGSEVWRKSDFNCILLQSPAYNNGRVYMAGMDMCLYASSAATGTQLWKTNTISGISFKDYWPVVHNSRGIVIIRPQTRYNDPNHFRAFPFDEITGQPVSLVIKGGSNHTGACAPPCIDRDGMIVTGHDIYPGEWYRVNPNTGAETFICQGNNSDENEIPSAAGNLIFVMHISGTDGGAPFTGCYNLNTQLLTHFNAPAGPGEGQSWHFNTQGGGTSPAVVANGSIYHLTGSGSGNGIVCIR